MNAMDNTANNKSIGGDTGDQGTGPVQDDKTREIVTEPVQVDKTDKSVTESDQVDKTGESVTGSDQDDKTGESVTGPVQVNNNDELVTGTDQVGESDEAVAEPVEHDETDEAVTRSDRVNETDELRTGPVQVNETRDLVTEPVQAVHTGIIRMLGLPGPPQELCVKRVDGQWHVTGPRDDVWVKPHHKLGFEDATFIDGQCDSNGKKIFEVLEESIEKIENEIETGESTTMGNRTEPKETNDPTTVIVSKPDEATTAGTRAGDVDDRNNTKVIEVSESTNVTLKWDTAEYNGYTGRCKGVVPLVMDGKKPNKYGNPKDAITCLYTLRQPLVPGTGLQLTLIPGVQYTSTGNRGPEWQFDADLLIPLRDVIRLNEMVKTRGISHTDKAVYVATLTSSKPNHGVDMNHAVVILVQETGSSSGRQKDYDVVGDLCLIRFSLMTESISKTTPALQKKATTLVTKNQCMLVLPSPGEKIVLINEGVFNAHKPPVAEVVVPPTRRTKRNVTLLSESSEEYERKKNDKRAREEEAAAEKKVREEKVRREKKVREQKPCKEKKQRTTMNRGDDDTKNQGGGVVDENDELAIKKNEEKAIAAARKRIYRAQKKEMQMEIGTHAMSSFSVPERQSDVDVFKEKPSTIGHGNFIPVTENSQPEAAGKPQNEPSGSFQCGIDIAKYFIEKERKAEQMKIAQEEQAKKAQDEAEQRKKEAIAKAEADKALEDKAELMARRKLDEMIRMNSCTLGVNGASAWNQPMCPQQVTRQHNMVQQQLAINQAYPFHAPGIGVGMFSQQQQLPLSLNQLQHQALSFHHQPQLQFQQQHTTPPFAQFHPATAIGVPGISVAMLPQSNAVWQQPTHQQQPLSGVGFFGSGSSSGVPQAQTAHEHQAFIQQQQVAAQTISSVAHPQASLGFGGLVNGMSLPHTNAAQQVALIQQQQQPAFNTSSSSVGNGSAVVQQQSNINSLPQQQQ